jgi:hypothetical protein
MKKMFLGIVFIAVILIIKACTAPTEETTTVAGSDSLKAVIDTTATIDSTIIDTLKK